MGGGRVAKLSIVEAVNLALREEMRRDGRVVVLGEDVGRNGGVFRATQGLFDEFGEERVIDTPLSESGIVGTAIGMAVYGLRPVAEIQFMGFVYLAFNQIVVHAARIRNRSRGRYHVPLVVRMPYGGGIKALEHHSESTEALFTHIPGLKVVVPATPRDAKGLLSAAIRDPDPVIFLEPKKIYRAFKEDVPEDHLVPLGRARLVKEGNDVSVIAWGAMVRTAEKAAQLAEERGVSAEVLDLRCLAPLDVDAVISSVKKTGRAVVVHEAPKTCGYGAELAALINEKALLSLEAPVERVTGQDITVPLPKGEDYYHPSAERVLWGIEKVMNF